MKTLTLWVTRDNTPQGLINSDWWNTPDSCAFDSEEGAWDNNPDVALGWLGSVSADLVPLLGLAPGDGPVKCELRIGVE